MPPRDRPRALHDRNGGTRIEPVDVDELAELHLVAQNDVVLVGGEGDVDGVGRVGEFDEEALFRQQILLVEVDGDDVRDLEERASVFSGGFDSGLHAVD